MIKPKNLKAWLGGISAALLVSMSFSAQSPLLQADRLQPARPTAREGPISAQAPLLLVPSNFIILAMMIQGAKFLMIYTRRH